MRPAADTLGVPRRGAGLADAVRGVDTVVHCASTPVGGDNRVRHPPDPCGPRGESFRDPAGAYQRWAVTDPWKVPVRLPDAVFAAYRAGGHPAPERAAGKAAFAEFPDRQSPE
ncbi:hypothetical protein [Nocardiopsis deserti]|uniref:hypothetical protein n=1 Tax=Nocardiopsis deserti TaxID=2605988 RepID=UPI001CC22C3C|nr:hypothetical protein [Nocardiopsis deserti]